MKKTLRKKSNYTKIIIFFLVFVLGFSISSAIRAYTSGTGYFSAFITPAAINMVADDDRVATTKPIKSNYTVSSQQAEVVKKIVEKATKDPIKSNVVVAPVPPASPAIVASNQASGCPGLVPIKEGQTVPTGAAFGADGRECVTCKNGVYTNRQACSEAVKKDPKNTILPVNAGYQYTSGDSKKTVEVPNPCIDSKSGNVGNTASGNTNLNGQTCFNGRWYDNTKEASLLAADTAKFCTDPSAPEWNMAAGSCGPKSNASGQTPQNNNNQNNNNQNSKTGSSYACVTGQGGTTLAVETKADGSKSTSTCLNGCSDKTGCNGVSKSSFACVTGQGGSTLSIETKVDGSKTTTACTYGCSDKVGCLTKSTFSCVTGQGGVTIAIEVKSDGSKSAIKCTNGCGDKTGCIGQSTSSFACVTGQGGTTQAVETKPDGSKKTTTCSGGCSNQSGCTVVARTVSSCSDCNSLTETCIPGGIGGKAQCTPKTTQTNTNRTVSSCSDCNSLTETCIPGGIGGKSQCAPKKADLPTTRAVKTCNDCNSNQSCIPGGNGGEAKCVDKIHTGYKCAGFNSNSSCASNDCRLYTSPSWGWWCYGPEDLSSDFSNNASTTKLGELSKVDINAPQKTDSSLPANNGAILIYNTECTQEQIDVHPEQTCTISQGKAIYIKKSIILEKAIDPGHPVFMQNGALGNTSINNSGLNINKNSTMNTAGCAPATLVNVLDILDLSPFATDSQNLDYVLNKSNLAINCTVDKGCQSGADAILKSLQDTFKVAGAFDNMNNNKIKSAVDLKTLNGVFLYQGDAKDPDVPANSFGHNAALVCELGKCLAYDSYTSGGQAQACSNFTASSLTCGTTTYKFAGDGYRNVAYFIPGSDK